MPVLTFGFSLILSLLFVPIVRRVSLTMGQVSAPREDRWHRKPTPTLGGVSMFVASVVGLLLTLLLSGGASQVRWGVLIGSSMMFGLGLYDDFRHITPPAKLVGQILASAVVIFFGVTTHFFTPRIADSVVAQLPNILLTFVWLIGITNAINLLDNMDGLASGIALITAGILSYFFWKSGDQGLLMISLAVTGSLLGFLVFNFPPASIFMGDSGSLFLGFTLAALAITRQPQASNVFAVMGVPTLLFLLPILDTALVTFTRLLRGQSPAQGGRDHTSHRLIAFGLTERQAVLTLYAVALVSGALAAFLESLAYWYSLVIVPLVILSLTLLTAYLGGLKVMTSPPQRGRGAVARIMLELTYRRRLLEVILDFFVIGIAYYLAFLIRFGLTISPDGLELYLQSLPVAYAGSYLALFSFGVYRGVWRYVGVDDLLRYLKAALGGVILLTVGVLIIFPKEGYSPVVFLLFAVFLFLGLAASRSSFRIMDSVSGQQIKSSGEKVLIYGAGDAGEMALRWIQMNPQLEYQSVGIIDEDPFLIGRQIHGVEVLGGSDKLEEVLKNMNIDGVILTANPSLEEGLLDRVIEVSRRHGCWVRSLRLEFELLER